MMSTSTREHMRQELKELAKLAETMGKTPPPPSPEEVALHRAATEPEPVSSPSHVTLPPISFPTTPPPLASSLSEDLIKPRKRIGLMAGVIGASLAVALAGGAMVGKSIASRSTTEGATGDVHAAAAVAAPQDIAPVAPALPPAVQAVQKEEPAVVVPVAVSPKPAPVPNAIAPAPSPAHKQHATKAAAVAPAAPKALPAAPPQAVAAASELAAPVKAAPAAAPKAAPAKAAGGGNDSLEDLIRKEVAEKK
jgi:hypothetical protein